MRHILGLALILTALAIILKKRLLEFSRSKVQHAPLPLGMPVLDTILVGIVLGALVTLSSIGAGALGTVALFLLYSRLPTARLVGTEIAHAVPLTLVAGLGHAGMGHIDWHLLGKLLCGSLPGIWIGSQLTDRLPDRALRPALAGMLAVVGAKLVW
jgi:uncharacterized membrane protein YfcA